MRRMLVVEDDPDIGPLVEHVLVRARYAVDRTRTAADALAHLERHSYDLVVADARLPDGSGMDIADRTARNGIKLLIITGYAFQYPDLRRYDFLMKPIRPDELLDEIARLLASA